MTGESDLQSHLHLVCKSEFRAIRTALGEVEKYLLDRGVPRSRISDLCLVLAEAMTNIARHAYRDDAGDIWLTLTLAGNRLRCKLVDHGAPFDPSALGHNSPDPAQLREGGYGWFIIRHLSEGVSYSHEEGRNALRLSVPLDPVT